MPAGGWRVCDWRLEAFAGLPRCIGSRGQVAWNAETTALHGPAPPASAVNFLKGAGEMVNRIRAYDWASTPLGPIEGWPQSLKTATGLIVQSPVPMVMLWGAEGVMIYNDAYSVFAGRRHPELLGSNVLDGWPEVAEFNDNVMKVGLAGGALAYRDQELTLNRTGVPEQVWTNLDYSPVIGEDGEPAGVIAIVVETTERVLADRRAGLEQARGTTWQVTPDLMGALNSNGYFETSNPAWQTILGWSEAEVASMSIFEMLHPDDVERTQAGFDLTQIGQPAIRFPNRYRRKDGGYRWISWVGVPEDGMVYCTGRDITDEVAAQEELAQAQEALRQSQKMEAVGQLTGGIAHDFNNLLTGIAGGLEMIERRLSEGRQDGVQRYIAVAQASTQRAAALTQRLLAFSRRQTLDPKPIDTNRLIASMADLIRRTVGPAIEVEVVEAGGLWSTRVDPSQLENALLNLAINARDAMPDGGRLTIETANKWLDQRAAAERELTPGQYLSLCVTDTGTGMAPDVISRVFDPFFTTKPLGQGTGLGLSMIHGFVRQSGGQVRIYSELGKGTTMCLYLPRFLGDAETPEAAEAGAGAESGHGETVLVIDDEEPIRMLITDVLEEAGYRVLRAADGPTGLKVLDSDTRIELLITDVGLPGGFNGRQVADAARAKRPDLKVLFITGYAENAVVGNGHLEPGMQVITKPFAIAALGARVREIIEG